MSKKKKSTIQLDFIFEKKEETNLSGKYTDANQGIPDKNNNTKVIYFDPRQELYKKILNRQMK